MKVAVWKYIIVLGTAQWLNMDSYRPLVLPMGLLLAALTNYDVPNVAFLSHFTATIIPWEVMFLTVVPPGTLLLVALMRSGKVFRTAVGLLTPVASPGSGHRPAPCGALRAAKEGKNRPVRRM